MKPDKMQQWIADIALRKLTMSQRKVTVIEKTEGGLENVITEAKKQGVHLIRLTDDKGNDLLTGSVHPFETLC